MTSITKIFNNTIVEKNRPTAIKAPEGENFNCIRTWTTEICYEEDYDEYADKVTCHYVCYNGNNRELEDAIAPIIVNSDNAKETWIKCASILFDVLKTEAISSIIDADFASAIGYIDSLDVQCHALSIVTDNLKYIENNDINKLLSLRPSLKIMADILNSEEFDYDE